MSEKQRPSLRRVGLLLLAGLVAMLGLALIVTAVQQRAHQQELRARIDETARALARPLPSADKLKAGFEEVKAALPEMREGEFIEAIVKLAKASGIDVDSPAGLLTIPTGRTTTNRKVAEGTYGVLSLTDIVAKGSPESVMAFVSRLEEGVGLKTAALKSVSLTWMEINDTKDEARAKELLAVQTAVKNMIKDNGLKAIPNPFDREAVNLMGDDPNTTGAVEGFPDATSHEDFIKGYTGPLHSFPYPRRGYVLYRHDKIDRVDTARFATVDYLPYLRTEYYYMSDYEGNVRQFDGPDIFTAKEYGPTIKRLTLAVAKLSLEVYTKPLPQAKPAAKAPAPPPGAKQQTGGTQQGGARPSTGWPLARGP